MSRLLGVWLLLAGIDGVAQSLSGQIVDALNAKPLVNVHVRWLNSSAGTLTNEEGKFSLVGVDGISVLRFSYVGYRTLDVDTDTLSTTSPTLFALEPSAVLLDQTVSVLANRHEQLSKNALPLVTLMDQQQLNQLSPRTTPEALMNAPGVWLQKTNHGGGAPIVRGLVGNQVLMLVDGIRLNNFTYRYGPNQYLNTVDPGMLQQIEVTRGGGSVLYGSDALGGVVQLVTKTPSFSSEQNVTSRLAGRWMSGGMEISGRAEVVASGPKLAVMAGYSQRRFGDLRAGGSLGTLVPTAYSESSGDLKLLLRAGKRATLTGSFQRTHQQDVPRFDQVSLGGYHQYQFDSQIRQLAYVRWESFSKKWWREVVKVTYANGYTSERLKAQRENSVTRRAFLDRVKTNAIVLELLSAPAPTWKVISGVEFYSDRVSSKANEVNTTTNTEVAIRGSLSDGSQGRSISLFHHHQLSLDRLELSAGARLNSFFIQVDDATFGDQQLSPTALVANIGLRYPISKIIRPFISIQSAFRAPNIDDMSKFGPVEANVFEIPSGKLSSEYSVQTEAGLRLHHHQVTASVAIYQNRLSNLIDRTATLYLGSNSYEGRNVFQKQNVGSAVLKGIEGDVEVSVLPSVRVTGNITYTYGTNTTTGDAMRRVPPLFARVGMTLNHKKWWGLSELSVAANQKRLAPGDRSDVRISSRLKDGVMPGWTSWNLSSGVDFSSWSAALRVLNVLDAGYRIFGSGVDEYGRTLAMSFSVKI